MALSQPLKKPEWNTSGSNRTEPTSGEKSSGWVLNDQPPSSYFNWLQYYTYAWIDWLNERFLKGATEIDLIINALPPTSTGAGGNLTLEAGDGLTAGAGGNVAINAGDGAGAAAGGNVAITAGDPDTSGGGGDVSLAAGTGIGAEGGDLTLSAGASDADGGDASLTAGANTSAGPGGDLTLAAGNAVGGNAGDASFVAGTANSPGPGQGGDLTLAAGDGFKEKGGDVSLTAGDADGTSATANGGAVTIAAGSGGVLGLGGAVTIQTGSSGTDYSGDLTLECLGGKDGGGSATLKGGNAWGPGGKVTITGGNSTVNNNGGALDLDAGDATGSSGDGGAVDINAGDGPDAGGAVTMQAGGCSGTGNGGAVLIEGGDCTGTGEGGDIDLNAGDGATTGKGGNVDAQAGHGVAAIGGAVRLTAGNATTGAFDGGTGRLRAGNALGSGDGGDAQLWAGSADSGAGGAADINAGPSTSGTGGAVDIDAGASTSGAGGAANIDAGDGATAGGVASLAAGDCTGTGNGGNASLTAGSNTGTSGQGGDLTLAAGDGKGTDKDSGNVSISTGDSTGTGHGEATIAVAEGASGTGSGVNTAAEYIKCDGTYANRSISLNRFTEIDNTVNTTRGHARIVPRTTKPSAPSAGDIWHDNACKQLKMYNGSRHAAMNQLFWNNSEQEMFGEVSQNILSPPAALSVSTDYVMHQHPYSGGVSTTNAFKADMLANAMREGAILRVRGHFVLSTDGTPPANRFTPDIIVMLGSIGSGPPFTGSTGDQIGNDGAFGSDQIWKRCAVECEGRYWEASSINYLDISWKYLFEEDAASPNPLSSPVKLGGSVNSATFGPTGSLQVFPRVDFGPFDAAWKVECEQFVIELL